VRELARGEFPPRHNLIAGHAPQGHYGPYFVALGWAARVTGARPRVVLYAAGLLGALALALAFGWITWRVAGAEAAGWSPWCAALLWGPWPAPVMTWAAWGWPGTTSPADAQNFYYPQHAAMVVLLVIVGVLLPDSPLAPTARPAPTAPNASQARERRRWITAALLGGLLVATHPLTGLALALATTALAAGAVIERGRPTWRVAALLLLPAVALAIAALWPYYPVLGLLEAFTHSGIQQSTSALASSAPPAGPRGALVPPAPTPIFSLLGPALVGLAGVVVLARRRQWFVLLWTAVSLAAVFCPGLPLRQRLLMFVAPPLHLGASVLLARSSLLDSGRTAARRVLRGAAFVMLAAGALSATLRARWVLTQEPLDLSFLPPLVPESAVVLSDPRTSNAVAGLTGRKIVAPEGPDIFLILAGGWQRNLDVERFLNPTATEAERGAIVERWAVTHVLVDTMGYGGPRLPYPVLYEGGGFILYDATAQ
jgi:hypothetical protein